ncbi:MAG: ABC transporter ATP-binding protein, partial [Pseudomonadota bacterium]
MGTVAEPLKVSNLSTGYRGRPVIDSLSLPVIAPGEIYALIGPNAAGKSTLLRALAGLLPASGSVRLGDRELMGLGLTEHARWVTYMPQSIPQGIALSVLETVLSALRASPIDQADPTWKDAARRAVEVLDVVGIADLAMEPLDRLSGGQRQLVSLAQALVREPRVLLLDEPISALDLSHQFSVMQLVQALAQSRDMIVVAVLHDLQTAARWSHGVIVLSDGRVAAA